MRSQEGCCRNCDLPQLDGLVVGAEEEAALAGLVHPAHFIDLLLDLKGLQVVKLRLMALELRHVPELETAEPGGPPGPVVYAHRPLHSMSHDGQMALMHCMPGLH